MFSDSMVPELHLSSKCGPDIAFESDTQEQRVAQLDRWVRQ